MLDDDGDIRNGIKKFASISEIPPKVTTMNILTVQDVTLSKNLIRRTHDITIRISLPPALMFFGKGIFIDFDGYYADNFERGNPKNYIA